MTTALVIVTLAVTPVDLPLPGRGADDVVDPEDHLGGLGGGEQDLALHAEALRDAEVDHVAHGALVHVCKKKVRKEMNEGISEGRKK